MNIPNLLKIKTFFTLKRTLATTGLMLLVSVSLVSPIHAQNVTQTYSADTALLRGLIVAVKEGDATKVEAVSALHMERMHGVVVDPNDAPVTLTNEGQRVYVATVGRYDVLVSNQNGTIAIGDYITVSSYNGIGMKADANQSMVVGKALAAYDGKNSIATETVNGNKVAIGRIQVDLSVNNNPLARTEANLPEFLRKATESIAHKPVSAVRAYISIGVFFASSIVAGALMYAGVRSSIISIGRNPLGKKNIMRGMIQIILVSLIIFISGIFGVYLLLKL
jgi:co-chaperonin GroES (HSP10)